MQGYKLGREGIQKIIASGLIKKVITGASAIGAMVMGALTAQFVALSTPVMIHLSDGELAVQTAILDKLFHGLLPLALTLMTLYLLKKKKMKSMQVMVILIVIGLVGGLFGIF